MPPPKLLAVAKPGDFVGEYKASAPGSGDVKVPIVDIYRGRIADVAQAALEASGTRVFEFMPIAGDERDYVGEPFAVAAMEGANTADEGHISANLSFVVAGPETTSHTSTNNPVLEGGRRFGRLFELLTRSEGIDRLYMNPEHTNLTGAELRMLGFQAVGDESGTLMLDLPVDKRPAPTAPITPAAPEPGPPELAVEA